ncbi:hypothetical protein KVR01_000565 [Diaporthe batatas]|uniref:uncharacterized protein n=1 Tax=Diaporthe batatas TaxID=748121 RepID=UPI001D053569|nr:uncharacterized protein KVR01_000565 [Diaporthe batatas]KAG8169820.1 hypothetical protein KVR01_000565 [Diaporthe batatas]
MEDDKQLPHADEDTDVKTQGDDETAISTDATSQEPEPPQEELRGFAARYASYLKYQEEHPEYDLEAEYERMREESTAAYVKQRQGKETYFFYGTLMDPAIAQKILGLEAPPAMRPAVLRNRGHLKMWGPYPAFVADQQPRVEVKGMICEVEGTTAKDRLAAYEGNKYDEVACLINPLSDDGSLEKGIYGWVFEWIGSADDLSDGTFDLEVYKAAKAELDAAEA